MVCDDAQGVVIVCGARAAGKSTIVAALLEHMIQDRRDHVIALEERIQVLHEREGSLVSQREVAAPQMLAAIRAALSEEPDVLREGRSPARAILISSAGVSALVAAGRLVDVKSSVESL